MFCIYLRQEFPYFDPILTCTNSASLTTQGKFCSCCMNPCSSSKLRRVTGTVSAPPWGLVRCFLLTSCRATLAQRSASVTVALSCWKRSQSGNWLCSAVVTRSFSSDTSIRKKVDHFVISTNNAYTLPWREVIKNIENQLQDWRH